MKIKSTSLPQPLYDHNQLVATKWGQFTIQHRRWELNRWYYYLFHEICTGLNHWASEDFISSSQSRLKSDPEE